MISLSLIPEEVIQEIRQKTDIVDIINQYVQLSKRGNNYTASCPFHEDRNPSFSVHHGKQIYKCFSCGRGGNVYGFLQEIEGIGFVEAVQKVAELANVPLDEQYFQPTGSSGQSKANQALREIHQKTMDFYHYYLTSTTNGEEALEYLLARSFTTETLATFKIGLAPTNSALLVQYLQKDDYSTEQLVDSGIFYLDDSGHLVDRFRGRIMFPLRNRSGDPVAFSGRVYDNATVNQAKAKYLNSPETELFHKTDMVFNMDLARPRIRQLNQVIVSEGYMDVMALYQAGYENVIATMGTSLTTTHLNQLAKLAEEIIFVFDGDDAGQQATARGFELAKGYRQQFKSIQIPNQQDPDDWIKEKGAASFQRLINQADSRFEFYRRYLKQNYDLNDGTQLAQYIEALIGQIALLQSPIEQQLRIQDIVQEYQLSETILLEQLAQASQQKTKQKPDHHYQPPEESIPSDSFYGELPVMIEDVSENQTMTIDSRRAYQSEKQFLASLIYYSEAWDYIKERNEPILLFHEIAQKVYFELEEYYYQGNALPLTGIVDKIKDTQLNHYLTTLIWENDPLGFADSIMEDCLRVIDQEFITLQIKELRQKLEICQREQRSSDSYEIINRIMQLTRQLKIQ